MPDFLTRLRGVVHFWMRRMTHISASGARSRSRPLSRVVLFEPHEALRASILALAHFQNRRWYHRSPQSTLGVVVLGRKQLGKQAAGFVLLFLRDDLSDARRRREKKGERRFVRRRSVVAVFSGGILKRRAAKRNRIGIKEIRNRIGIVLLLLLLLRESFGKEKEGKKRRTTIFSLSTTTTKTPPPPVITCSTNLACVVVGLFSTRRHKKEKTTTTRSNEND